MGQAFDVQDAESQAAQEMQRRIGNHLSYADRIYRLLDLAISQYDEREIPVGSADYVTLLLMGRMANDVRAIGGLARLGYGVQACTVAASVFEIAFIFVDVVTDEQRAAAWSSHADASRASMKVKESIHKFVNRMPWSEEEKRKAKCRQMAIYKDLCAFKHANPVGMFPRPNGADYSDNRLGPDTTVFGVLSASAAILHAGSHVGLALYQWVDARPLPTAARTHFDEELAALLRQQDEVDEQTRGLRAEGPNR